MFKKSVQFLKDVRFELGKVAWPPRDELIGSTIVVIVLSVILSLFVGIIDYGLSQAAFIIYR